MNPAFSDMVSRVKAAGQITAEDVLAMRAQVYGAPEVAREDVEALIALDQSAHEAAPEWGGVWVGLLGFTTVCLFFASLMAIDLMRNLNDFHDTPVASGMVRAFASMFGG